MTKINLNPNNLSETLLLLDIFVNFDDNYEYTARGIFRRKIPTSCPICSSHMTHNGYNIYTKKGLGEVKIGRYKCSNCCNTEEESRSFWEDLKSNLFNSFNYFFRLLRYHNVSYEGISSIMDFILPRSRSTILREFNKNMEQEEVPSLGNVYIVHYDEQHPKEGRCQKYRLTLLDARTQRPLADELFDDKNSKTIKKFLKKHLDASEPVFIVTDFDNTYPEVLNEVMGDKLVHQYCLMHLNKLVVKDFGRKTTIEQELLKYKILNIFYNREKEIKFLENLIPEELSLIGDEEKYKGWIKAVKEQFYKFVYKLKLERRRNKKNIPHNDLEVAKKHFDSLMENIRTYDEVIQKRLRMINKHWLNLTMFYYLPGAPATNNPIESYFSKSLRTDHKKQFRTDLGIENQIKLAKMKRADTLTKPGTFLLEMLRKFTPFKAL